MPSLSDNGRSVSLDLHGVRLHDAERMILEAVRLAAERGRTTLTVVHGASTSSLLYRNHTIRHALYDLLDAGRLDRLITDALRLEGSTILSLPLHSSADPARIAFSDLGR